MWMSYRTHALSLLSVGLLLTAIGCQSGDADPPPATEVEADHVEVVRLEQVDLEDFAIVIDTAGPGTLTFTKTFPGEVRVNEDRFAHVVPRLPGIVRTVYVTLGDHVEAGQLMAVLESRELAELKANYLDALARLELARATYEREARLYREKVSSEQEYLEARQALAEAEIALRSAMQKLMALGFSQRYIESLPDQPDSLLRVYQLRAPIRGTVVAKHIVQGEAVEAFTTVFTVADLSTVWVDLSIYQQDLARIHEGQRVTIVGLDHQEEGIISYVQPLVEEDRRTGLARVVLPNPHGRWKPGLFVTGQIMIGQQTYAVVVPRAAIQTMDDHPVVFVPTPEGFMPRRVQLAAETDSLVALADGLAPGEPFVVQGAFTLKAELEKEEIGEGHAH
ncbi:efflux RND transporter periplasmic adaptor subunit [Rhodothermus profundi]|uniref:Membrane fusion protein, cobalt-zinc-cadmium efflux system n=1 Tax=Rhodothermus profundi TaxID=633813 RepID=A0A1M6TPB3_9BACT|nr:efflux RND transporter periplasmic adaptor subunit [Rhodothermus profundi]SHK58774.1 membrane fusion protein, cobalt-zinc-cadmium efflux system [Rhodothermus profundi]